MNAVISLKKNRVNQNKNTMTKTYKSYATSRRLAWVAVFFATQYQPMVKDLLAIACGKLGVIRHLSMIGSF